MPRNLFETAVAWIDIALLVAGFAVCVFLSKAFLSPAPNDPHGGGFELIGLLLVMPAMAGALVAWLSMRRRERWRWWAQLLPFAIFYMIALLFDVAVLDSAWQVPFVIGIPWLGATSYALFGGKEGG